MAALPINAHSAHTFPIIEKAARRAARLWFTGTPHQTLYAWREDSCAYHCDGRPNPAAAGDAFRAEFSRELAAIIAGGGHDEADEVPATAIEAMDAGCEAAHAWHVSLIDRLEAVDKATGVSGYCVASGLRDAFNVLPADQQGAFLDAVGAYLMTCHAEGVPTREFNINPELLVVYASTPAEQDAWVRTQWEAKGDE